MTEAAGQTRQRSSASVAVYRPPAARMAENRQRAGDIKTETSKRCRVRRPDQQMYVPRPKRGSFGDEQSRSRSSSRTSLENGSCEKRKSSSRQSIGEDISSEVNVMVPSSSNIHNNEELPTKDHRHSHHKRDAISSSFFKTNVFEKDSNLANDKSKIGISNNVICKCSNTSANSSLDLSCNISTNLKCNDEPENTEGDISSNMQVLNKTQRTSIQKSNLDLKGEILKPNEMPVDITNEHTVVVKDKKCSNESNTNIEQEKKFRRIKDSVRDNSDSINSVNREICNEKQTDSKEVKVMKTIFISSNTSDSSITSIDTKDNCFTNGSKDEDQTAIKMEIEQNCDSTNENNPRSNLSKSEEKNLKNKQICNFPVTNDILDISDSSSSSDDLKQSKEPESSVDISAEVMEKQIKFKVEKSSKRNKIVNPEECDWESLYDDNGECLVPDLMEELTKSVGNVRVATAESDYRPYQTVEERSNDGECVIEIYDFPADFKTSDLMNIFATYRNKNFQIKWVDDTHALGVFPSPLMADEVLTCTLPFVKTRPLRLGIAESRNKARNLILPPLPSAERPKTCTALARRLVSGALGLRLPTSSQDREKEKQVLKEAREKRRLEAKQREAAWNGTLVNDSCE